MVSLLAKLVGISVGLAVAIKYLAPPLAIAATTTNALIGVLVPPVVLAVILTWRSRQPTSPNQP